MTVPISQDARLSCFSAQERRDFIKLRRRKDFSFEPILQEKKDLQQRTLREKTAEFAEILTQRQQETERVMSEITEEVIAIDPLGSARLQKENLQQAVESLRHKHEDLKEKLDISQSVLHEREVKKAELQHSLHSLTEFLHGADGQFYSFQPPLYEIGRKLNVYLSQVTKKE